MPFSALSTARRLTTRCWAPGGTPTSWFRPSKVPLASTSTLIGAPFHLGEAPQPHSPGAAVVHDDVIRLVAADEARGNDEAQAYGGGPPYLDPGDGTGPLLSSLAPRSLRMAVLVMPGASFQEAGGSPANPTGCYLFIGAPASAQVSPPPGNPPFQPLHRYTRCLSLGFCPFFAATSPPLVWRRNLQQISLLVSKPCDVVAAFSREGESKGGGISGDGVL